MVTTPLLFSLARKLAGASRVAGGRPSPSVAQGADGNALFAQGGDIRLACKDMFGITLKAQPPVRQATAVFAGPQTRTADGALRRLGEAGVTDHTGGTGGKVQTPATVGCGVLPQLADQRLGIGFHWRPVQQIPVKIGLAQRNGGQPHVFSSQYRANGS